MPLKIIHTADWHLGQTFYGYDRAYEHQHFLDWLLDTMVAEAPDVLLMSGDVFDVSNPAASAQQQWYRFLRQAQDRLPHLQMVFTAGNHDSGLRLEVVRPLLDENRITVIGSVPRTPAGTPDYDALCVPLRDATGAVAAHCLAVPFLRPSDCPPVPTDPEAPPRNTYAQGIAAFYAAAFAHLRTRQQPGQALVAMGHLHTLGAEASPEGENPSERTIMGGQEFVPVTAFDAGLTYTALGHIHKAQRIGGREAVRYAGSPLPLSFSEINYQHQVLRVTLAGEQLAEVHALPVSRTVDVRVCPVKPAPLEDVLAELQSLPDKPKDAPADAPPPPFLEVRVLLEGPEPGLRPQIEAALVNKHARFTRVITAYPQRADTAAAITFQNIDELRQLQPKDIFTREYQRLYRTEPDPALLTLFHQAEQEALTPEDRENPKN